MTGLESTICRTMPVGPEGVGMPRSRRERDLYRYRPDDVDAQRDAAHRMQARREQELREIAADFEGSLRDRLEEGAAPPLAPRPIASRSHRKKSAMKRLIDALSDALGVRRRKGRRSHRR